MLARRGTPLLLVFVAACAAPEPAPQQESAAAAPAAAVSIDPAALQAFQPLPDVMASPTNPSTPEKVTLGRMLYYDARVSTSGDVSCYVCHPLHDYGTSHRRTGVGHGGQVGDRNEPSVYNAAGHLAQFWDGHAADVEAQALGPVLDPGEMGMADAASVIAVLKSIPGYVEAFTAAFPGEADPVTFENFGRAIGAFERGLVTPGKWDAFLKGDATALSDAERTGFNDFVSTGCGGCHMGTYVGGSMYMKAGLVNPWFNQSDIGRAAVTENDADRMVFKVPSLRNVEETWPYFHDGSVQHLDDAIALMAWHQLGRQLTDEQVASIAAWLETLTGPVAFEYVNEPALPRGPMDPKVGG